MHPEARLWIDKLRLQPHPEGGFYRETYRAGLQVLVDKQHALKPRSASTAIYFLLDGEHPSAFHRIQSDEVWHFYAGNTVRLHRLGAQGLETVLLSNRPDSQSEPQRRIAARTWFAAEVESPFGFALVGCTVAPGFEFLEFEIADPETLAARYPQERSLIKRLSIRA